ncbi:UDP-N-acetylmuramate--L-alanine ligase [Anaerovorax odorimutans]|uniref:UDP-N-acetylmuramate--L-alanine ligase n=1 Tax=Anaerovorax odorimutans TaxID=109327 RepID=A0ABT1RQ98_9FIRM|nr:UDP-N-acetylmuramate--L-alanine ligase [Anaerovorax odorimutans]MCQ4637061.1 UDP-N-acetylmuramate--L-alanine ligase [Anaerovorax odorimutans]
MVRLSDCKQIHCIGIGGIGLSAIAEILLSRGYKVTGSDMRESDITERLMKDGADIFLGHRAKNVEGADLIVYSAAVGADNPELAKAKELGIPTASRAEILGLLMSEYENSIAISGTHGKTTTTSMVSLILKNAEEDPTILVGGNLPEIGGNVKVGHSQHFVTEACEYMDSFLSLRPKIEIILNIDSDHLDYFKDIEHIARSFEKFASLVPENGTIIAYDANPFVKSVVQDMPNVMTFGFNESCDYHVSDITFNADGMPDFYVNRGEETLCRIQLSIPGEHNILNALAAFACCHILGVSADKIAATLETFTGTQRRFDILGTTSHGIKIIDDYAHHPTEIKATLSAVKNMRHNKMWCLFQPHTYTRTMALFDEFAESFEAADKVVLAEIYAAREKNIYKISSKGLVSKIKEAYPDKDAYFFEDFEEIANFVYNNAEPGDLVITMGAGDIYKVGEMILEKDRKF